jgi:Fic family protein
MATLAPVGSETLHWAPTHDRGYTHTLRSGGLYRAVIPAPIADLDLVLPAAAAARAEAATVAVVRFDAEHAQLGESIARVLRRAEAMASSRIENIHAAPRAVAEAELAPAAGKAAAAQVVANIAAVATAQAAAGPVDAGVIAAVHEELMGGQVRHTPGQWRTEAVWIGGHTPCTAVFVPPRHERVPAAIEDLAAFVERSDVPLLAQIAVAHAQFETIHPFTDGNGRTGRALVASMLRGTDLVRDVTVPLSVGLAADVGEYIAALTAFRSGDPVPIVDVFARTALLAANHGAALVRRLCEVRAGWDDRISARAGASVWRVADLLVGRPVVNAALVGRTLGIAADHPRRYLAPLIAAGIVVESTGRTRDRIWRTPEMLAVLDDFS